MYRQSTSQSSSSTHRHEEWAGTSQPATQQHVDPYEVFKKAFEDMGLEEVQQYFKELNDDTSHAMGELFSSNNWTPIKELAQ